MIQRQPSYYAFFDVDGTIINIKSMFNFLKYLYVSESEFQGLIKYYIFKLNTILLEKLGVDREYLNTRYYKNFRNYSVRLIEKIGEKWFKQEIRKNENLFIKNVINEIEKHKSNNAEIVLISGSFSACLKPIAEYLNINEILSTDLEIRNGKFTGKILQQTIGKGKVEIIRQFLYLNKYSQLQQCYVYGDHESDIDMLNMVGNPCVVAGDKNMESYAKNRNWKIIYK